MAAACIAVKDFFRGVYMSSLILAILGCVFVFIGAVPMLGWLNWIGIAFCLVGLISGVSGYRKNPVNKIIAAIGAIICGLLLVWAIIRLIMGGGIV